MVETSRRASSSADWWIRSIGGHDGATLIEVVATVTLFGLVGIGIYSLAMLPVRALEGAHESVLYDRSVQSLFRTMTADLANITPSGYVMQSYFSGKNDRMEFSAGTWEDADGPRIVEYTFHPWWTRGSPNSDDMGRMTRGEIPMSGGAFPMHQDRPSTDVEVEIFRAARLSFEYFDADDGLWLNEWDPAKERRPVAVRVVSSPDGLDTTKDVEMLFPLFSGRTFRGEPSG